LCHAGPEENATYYLLQVFNFFKKFASIFEILVVTPERPGRNPCHLEAVLSKAPSGMELSPGNPIKILLFTLSKIE